jgi:hypothetical protein
LKFPIRAVIPLFFPQNQKNVSGDFWPHILLIIFFYTLCPKTQDLFGILSEVSPDILVFASSSTWTLLYQSK